MKRFAVGVALIALLVGSAVAADLKSGPQEGSSVGAFHPLNVTGKWAGQKQCLV
jgi:opacity protein-like surface antigen